MHPTLEASWLLWMCAMLKNCNVSCPPDHELLPLLIVSFFLVCGFAFSSVFSIIIALACSVAYFFYLHELCKQDPLKCPICNILPVLFLWIFVSLAWYICRIGNELFPPYGGFIISIILLGVFILYHVAKFMLRDQNFCTGNGPKCSDVEEASPNEEKVTPIQVQLSPSVQISTNAQENKSNSHVAASSDEIKHIVNDNNRNYYSTIEYAHESHLAKGLSVPCCCAFYGVVKRWWLQSGAWSIRSCTVKTTRWEFMLRTNTKPNALTLRSSMNIERKPLHFLLPEKIVRGVGYSRSMKS